MNNGDLFRTFEITECGGRYRTARPVGKNRPGPRVRYLVSPGGVAPAARCRRRGARRQKRPRAAEAASREL
jgi:hypothetical protein